jgi:phosphinothricin acetyltransferase
VGKRLDQVRGFTGDDIVGDRAELAVVDRFIDVVRGSRALEGGLDLDVDRERLRPRALCGVDAVPALERHALETDSVHAVNLDFGAMELVIRGASLDDLGALNDIYNEYVLTTHFTFDVDPMEIAARREWFGHYAASGRHHVLVAIREGAVVGYTTSSGYRPKAAYDTSVETSIYLAPGATGGGIGTRLYQALFTVLHGEDVHRAYAGIALPNPASIALHERFGFKKVAHFTEQGRKFNRYWDVAWFEKPLGESL